MTFLPLSTLVVRPSQSIKEGRGAGVIGWANTLVQTEERYQKAIDFLLARTLVVDTLDNALLIARKHEQRLRIVTLSGELLNPGGSLSGGSRQHAEASFLNRSGEIEDLDVKLLSSNTIVYVESQAKDKLGMKNPDNSHRVFLSTSETPEEGFADMLKAKAYN